jgi:hypothetical protein
MFGKNIKNVVIVCNDAGAANLIAPWVKFYKYNYFFKLKGAAKKVFKRYLPNIYTNTSLQKIIKNSDIVITGTSTISNVENQARLIAIKNKKKVVAVMDHWVLYKESLIYKNKLYLPNEIWVTNKFAYHKAKKEFKKTVIKRKINFFEKSIKKIKKNKNKIKNYLYFLEPINNSIEFIALKNFFSFLNKLKIKKKINIKFKLHPRENIKKYKKFLKLFNQYNYKIIKDHDLRNLLEWSNIIFGLRSYALVLGLLAKRPVYSLLPIKNFRNTIPYKIKMLNKISKKQISIIKK